MTADAKTLLIVLRLFAFAVLLSTGALIVAGILSGATWMVALSWLPPAAFWFCMGQVDEIEKAVSRK